MEHGTAIKLPWSFISKQVFGYRKDPVPCLSVNKHRGRYYRSPSTYQELRVLSDKTHRSYSRGKRRNLVDAWCDTRLSNPTPKSWKDCTKKRYQWQ